MLTTTAYDPDVHGSPTCDGCGRHHLLPGNDLYVLDARLMIACGCVVEESVRLTRVLCVALTATDFALLIGALCAEASLRVAVSTRHKLVLVKPATCGLCKEAVAVGDDLCEFCAASLRGWI